ncbi:hypothetical protein [Burkholderia sp. Bp8998]|uniref:hypothetical protein n=1 Tax=Burkholderia sp. Bp8998 TaxID=2184557 RepID=UPI000F596E6C|nr:hypothetical protein [Burkholderia sp. Bp8998]RQS17845.1 hypothetical protein DIE06_15830 [Burkholderia sp. Bp8998]
MKRMALAVLGFGWGLLVTWATICILDHIDWPEAKSHAAGCNDMEHCTSHAKFLAGMFITLLWPAVACAVLNAVAYKRWACRRWGSVFFGVTLLAALFYSKPYVVPYIGLAG